MPAAFPTANSVFLVGCLKSHSVEAGTGALDLIVDLGGMAVKVRVSDKILAAAVEPALSARSIIQISGSVGPGGEHHHVAVSGERGHDLRVIGAGGEQQAPLVREEPRPSPGAEPMAGDAPAANQPQRSPGTGLRRTLGRGPVGGTPTSTVPAPERTETTAAVRRPSFIGTRSRGTGIADQEPAMTPHDSAPTDGADYAGRPTESGQNSPVYQSPRRTEPDFGTSLRDQDIPF